ncbi:MAG TPA: hypothetical protein PLF71_01245 [bacterium]|nr:MAG: D-alanyl-D-alanine carboxypeptidase DacB precursor [Parcubacteria group bacterium ADurb.Bin192]HPN14730.1 hypothetical protein [bacterium]
MFHNLFGLLAVMAMAPAPTPFISPVQMYGQSVPVQPVLAVQNRYLPAAGEVKKTFVAPPVKKNNKNIGPKTTGKSVFVADVASGGVLFGQAQHDVLPIASLTKLMTALVVLESEAGLEGDLTFSNFDFDRQSKNVFLAGDVISKKDAMRALLIGSVNSSASALAGSTGLSRQEFVERMNQKAKELNLPSLYFVEPTGLDPGNKGSAADVAALITIVLRREEIRDILDDPSADIKTADGRQYIIKSTNLLLPTYLNKTPYKITGAKTGSLPEAGFCMAQVTRNADGNEVVAVLLGSDNHFSRYNDIKALTGWAFESFTWSK